MSDDDAQACWHQVEVEQRQRYEQEQRRLMSDPAYENWLKQLDLEMNRYEICSESVS